MNNSTPVHPDCQDPNTANEEIEEPLDRFQGEEIEEPVDRVRDEEKGHSEHGHGHDHEKDHQGEEIDDDDEGLLNIQVQPGKGHTKSEYADDHDDGQQHEGDEPETTTP